MTRMLQNGWMCSNNSNWSRVVHSPSGGTYVVSFGRVDNPEERGVQHDFSCTCPDFAFRRNNSPGAYCKHIRRVQKERCTWNTQFNGPEQPVREDGVPKCPHCNSLAISTVKSYQGISL
jgi:hypothetical protein